MEEYGAAQTSDPGPRVVGKNNHDVIEMIFAHKIFMRSSIRKPHRAIVVSVTRIVAPAITGSKRSDRKRRPGPPYSIWMVEEDDHPPVSNGARPVALSLAKARSASAQPAPDGDWAKHQTTLRRASADGEYLNLFGDYSHDKPL